MKKLVLLITLFLLNLTSAQTVVQGDITNDLTLTSSNTYLLRGFVRVKSGATLTIQPGTVIYGENSSQGSLIVQPGGRIIANGTQENPIVFTSEFRKPGASRTPTYGDWGGIIILGNARINVPGGTAQIEGPGDTYGGTNDEDNSGILRYVRVEYPGIAFSPNNEINGITFGGVGRGTTLEYIQVSFSGDDSFEWFGGNVNGKYLIAYKGWDDDFDTDFGFSGKLQFLLSVRDPQIADQSASNGFESDNDGSGSGNAPLTSPTWYNVTLIGPKHDAGTQINSLYKRGMHLRRNSQNKISNALIMGWPTGVLLDGTGTINGAVSGTNFIQNTIISGATSKDIDTTKSNGTFSPVSWFTTTMSGRIYTTNSEVKLQNPFSSTQPNFLPASDSPVLTGAAVPPADGFFDPTAAYIGAFKDVNWTETWADFNPTGPTSVEDEINVNGFELSQNYPNPFNPETVISYQIAVKSKVTLEIFDILGREVARLVDIEQEAGKHSVKLNAENLPSGNYIYRLRVGSALQTKKMTLLK